MAEAIFAPGPLSGRGITPHDSYQKAEDDRMSLMERASRVRQSQQMEQMRAQEIAQQQIMAPVNEAKAKAELVGVAAGVANQTRIENLRAKAAAESPTANNEFIDATSVADWDAQSTALMHLQAKYSWMGLLPEYKGYLDAVDKARANAVTRAATDKALATREEIARQNNEARTAGYQAGLEGRKYSADQAASSRVAATQITADARKDSAGAAMDRTEVRAFTQSAIEADREALKFAEAGNEDEAAKARHRGNAFRIAAKAKAAEGDAAPASPEPTPSPKPIAADTQKLYVAPQRDGELPSFAPTVKTPDDILKATQQMLDDGVIDKLQADELLTNLGFPKKKRG